MRMPRISDLADILKIATMFIKTTFEELKIEKELKVCIKM